MITWWVGVSVDRKSEYFHYSSHLVHLITISIIPVNVTLFVKGEAVLLPIHEQNPHYAIKDIPYPVGGFYLDIKYLHSIANT